MKYYVIYEYYTEYNQFEGSWDKKYEEFNSYDAAKTWYEKGKRDRDIRDIVGPLALPRKKGAKKVYYAHPVSLYNTPQELKDIQLLEFMGFVVINPNTEENAKIYQEKGMAYFLDMVEQCDAMAFRAFPDGRIPAGIYAEICAANGKPVIELPSGISRRGLSIDQTREYLNEVGYRQK